MIDHWGSPSWYITIAPADINHPICLYFSDDSGNHVFTPDLHSVSEKAKLVISNPVGHARFFHYFVSLFLQETLGINADHEGWFGHPVAHYATVEQQGQLALHLHMLLWLKGAYSPQQIRDRILDPNSTFLTNIIAYLESAFAGDFIFGSMSEVKAMVNDSYGNTENLHLPTHQLPTPVPHACQNQCGMCENCNENRNWWKTYQKEVDFILLKSNVHDHELGLSHKDKGKGLLGPYCEKNGKCKAQFPRPCFPKTTVDLSSGHLDMKKREAYLNTIVYVLTYLLRCNTDVTSLLSGTAIKAVIAYITDYISKNPLKTYLVFETIKAVYTRNKQLIHNSGIAASERACQVINKIVNALVARCEIGAPLASLYLLGNPDHYTDHAFKYLPWRKFVKWAQQDIDHCSSNTNDLSDSDSEDDNIVSIQKVQGRYVGLSPVVNYIHRPKEYEQISVYDWVRLHHKETLHKNARSIVLPDDELSDSSSDSNSPVHPIHAQNLPDIPAKYYRPLESHPLFASHIFHCVKDRTDIVADLSGGSLPKCNNDEMELYCQCMLTLFKPWRSGTELINCNQTWEQAFTAYTFTARQLEIMKNIKTKHECRDARDDYYTIMKNTPPNTNHFTPLKMPSEEDIMDLQQQSIIDNFDHDFEDDMRLYANGQYGKIANTVFQRFSRS